jgi:hypothetical protein
MNTPFFYQTPLFISHICIYLIIAWLTPEFGWSRFDDLFIM